MSEEPAYEVVVIGGGPAGLTTALYTLRLGHRTAVFEREGGRHTAVANIHNLYGVSEDVSGSQLAELAARQFEEYGGDVYEDAVDDVRQDDGERRFRVEATRATVAADVVVFATGFTDVPPDVPGLRRFTGRGLHYCLHCDVYTLGDGSTYVLGHGEEAAEVAMVLLNVTDDVDLLLDGRAPEWDDQVDAQLRVHPIDRIDEEVTGAYPADAAAAESWLGGLEFADGTEREYLGGFAMYGREYNSSLAGALGCDLADDGAIDVDDDYETSVAGAYAVGDVTHGQNQTPTAIGDGAQAGIAIHKRLRRFPVSADDVDGDEDFDAPGASAALRARMRRIRERGRHAGLREPTPSE